LKLRNQTISSLAKVLEKNFLKERVNVYEDVWLYPIEGVSDGLDAIFC